MNMLKYLCQYLVLTLFSFRSSRSCDDLRSDYVRGELRCQLTGSYTFFYLCCFPPNKIRIYDSHAVLFYFFSMNRMLTRSLIDLELLGASSNILRPVILSVIFVHVFLLSIFSHRRPDMVYSMRAGSDPVFFPGMCAEILLR